MIYKYNNRKLYDKERCRFTSLSELEIDIKNGREIKVKDITENDITNEILLSILANRKRTIDNNTLHNLIKNN